MLEDLSQHILDIAENSLNAGATEIEIRVAEDVDGGWLVFEVIDNGRGMDEVTLKRVTDPFCTSRTARRVGLGLPFLKQSSELCGGSFDMSSEPGAGTEVRVTFRYDCIDRPPLGNIPSTLVSLLVGHPEIRWRYRHRRRGKSFSMDSREIVSILGGAELLSSPDVALWLKGYLKENLGGIGVEL